MNTATYNALFTVRDQPSRLPTTSRGRALYTVDWFLNGQPVLNNHDNPCLSLRHGVRC